MRKLNNCVVENCIPTPSSCVEWNGGDIPYLGICNGDNLNNVIIDLVTKLQAVAGVDLSTFNIDQLLTICNQVQPVSVDLISILTLLSNNESCLNGNINTLSEQIAALSQEQAVTVNLKCFAQSDNLGNPLAVTRASLDQLIIDNLCADQTSITSLEGDVVTIQSQLNILENAVPVPTELTFGTCLNSAILPTSTQVIKTTAELCSLEGATGDAANIASALALTPSDLNTEYGTLTGWISSPATWADNYNNLLIETQSLRNSIAVIMATCCAPTCGKIELLPLATIEFGSSPSSNTLTLDFGANSGSLIPFGYTDGGSIIKISGEIDGTPSTITITTGPSTSPLTMIDPANPITNIAIGAFDFGTLTVGIQSVFLLKNSKGAVIMTCNGCFEINVSYTSPCCQVTNSTGGVPITMIYKILVDSNYVTKVVTIVPDETFIIPDNAIVTAVTGTLTTSCVTLPTPETPTCYKFQWVMDSDAGAGACAWGCGCSDSPTYAATILGTTLGSTYDACEGIGAGPYAPTFIAALSSAYPGAITDVVGYGGSDGDESVYIIVGFTTFPSIMNTMSLKFKVSDGRTSEGASRFMYFTQLPELADTCPFTDPAL